MRVGFTASRKVGIAVERNRARRRLRAAVHEIMALHAAPGRDYVVIARAGTAKRSFRGAARRSEGGAAASGAYREAPAPAGDR